MFSSHKKLKFLAQGLRSYFKTTMTLAALQVQLPFLKETPLASWECSVKNYALSVMYIVAYNMSDIYDIIIKISAAMSKLNAK